MATRHEQLLQTISRLPSARIEEVEDFVDFLTQRTANRELVHATAAPEPAFGKIWDNPEDDVYDGM